MAFSTPIFNIFGPSPVRPLETHIDKAHACAKQLLPFFQAVIANDWDKAKACYDAMAKLETDADKLKKDLRSHLHKDLFLPVPRGDLLNMLRLQDKIANRARDIAGLVLGRRMTLPKAIETDYLKFLQRSIDASSQAHKAINELDELLETGFRGKVVSVVEKMLTKLDSIERDTDEQQIKLRRALQKLETELPPVDCIFLYKVIEQTGSLADRAQSVGHQLQILLAR